MKSTLSELLIILFLLFPPISIAQGNKLEPTGDAKFPPFTRVDEPVTARIPIKGGPVDNDTVTAVVSCEVSGKSNTRHGSISFGSKGKVEKDAAVIPFRFRVPGQRNNIRIKLRYRLDGKESETSTVSGKFLPAGQMEISHGARRSPFFSTDPGDALPSVSPMRIRQRWTKEPDSRKQIVLPGFLSSLFMHFEPGPHAG